MNRWALVLVLVVLGGEWTAAEDEIFVTKEVEQPSDEQQDYSDFGYSVAMSNDSRPESTVVVGAKSYGSNSAGAAFVWTLVGAEWKYRGMLDPPVDKANLLFGASVSVDMIPSGRNMIVVGCPNADEQGTDAGDAVLYTQELSMEYTRSSILTPSDGSTSSVFGYSVCLRYDTLAIGAPGINAKRGAVYMYKHSSGSTFTFDAKIIPASAEPGDHFGDPLALSRSGILVAAAARARNDSGVVYVYQRESGTFELKKKYLAVNERGVVAVRPKTASMLDDTRTRGTYLYTQETTWNLKQTIVGDYAGVSLCDDNTLITVKPWGGMLATAYRTDTADERVWRRLGTLSMPSAESTGAVSAAAGGKHVVIGSTSHNSQEGAAYVACVEKKCGDLPLEAIIGIAAGGVVVVGLAVGGLVYYVRRNRRRSHNRSRYNAPPPAKMEMAKI